MASLAQATVGTLSGGSADPSFWYTLAAGGCFTAVAMAASRLSLSRRALTLTEALGFIPASAFIALASFNVGLEVRPELMVVTALTYLLTLRAALVPSSATHTLVLCLSIGVPVVIVTYVEYSGDTSLPSPAGGHQADTA